MLKDANSLNTNDLLKLILDRLKFKKDHNDDDDDKFNYSNDLINQNNLYFNNNNLVTTSKANDLNYDLNYDLNEGYLNTDTKLEALGGLSIWQLTAIIIGILIVFILIIWIIKTINIKRTQKLAYFHKKRTSSVRTSYSIDSCQQLIQTSKKNCYSNSLKRDNFLKPLPEYV